MVKAVLLKQRPLWLRWEIIIFLVIFPLTLRPCIQHIQDSWIDEEPDYPSNSSFAFIFDHIDVPKLEPYTLNVMIPIILAFVEILLLLLPYWSVNIRCKFHYMKASEKNATHVAFYPKQYHGTPGIVKLNREKGKPPYTIFQQKKRELIDGQWCSLKYPVNLTVSEYVSNKGLTDREAATRLLHYGQNSYSVPIPKFIELYFDQIRSPLFVFQVFSILCYLLDEYWTYPLFSLVMLLFMEGTTVRTRQSNLLELRGVETPPVTVYVKRSGEWKKITSDLLVPGDLVLLDQEVLCPCDFVIINGRAVVNEAMLTGESTPQVKDPINSLSPNLQLDLAKNRRNILFGGTTIEQIIPTEEKNLPSKGVICTVLSTGLGSSQGRLIRTIMFASDKMTVESKDSFYLLLFLSIFGIIAATYVVIEGKKAGTINNFRLIVETLLILTATIPPDLPVQLNFNVNASLLGLSKLKVYCTEPYRIPFAGMISVCCFDKTGTLTAEEYRMIGVDDMNNAPPSKKNAEITGNYFNDSDNIPIEALWVIGGCHSLIRGKYGQLVGDSLEATAFSSMKFKLSTSGIAEHKRCNIENIKSYHFSSELRRMTTICTVDKTSTLYALMKGAPDTVKELLEDVPKNYDQVCRDYTRQGCRVLTLAYRKLGQTKETFDSQTPRDVIEQRMTFSGFIIFSAALKRGSEDTIAELLSKKHRVIIITGDDPLTACHVAKTLHMIVDPIAIHDLTTTDENGNEIKDDNGMELCYTGRAIDKLNDNEFEEVVKKCNIFARMQPQMKEKIIIKLNQLGEKTIMCGDGTNDVGALKQAHVGVGLIEQSAEANNNGQSLQEMEEYKPKLGAASIASPFVSKRSTVSGCIDIIRYGRSTLSSTLDLFKQLSLNCLIGAYTLSVLFIENVRFGERQMMVSSSIIMIASMSISWAVPKRQLSVERPFPGQFNLYLICSVLLQFGFHFLFLYLTHQLVYAAGYKVDKFNYLAHFSPSLLNTAMFIMKAEMEIVTILINYRGSPFMQSFTENKMLLIGTILSAVMIGALLIGLHPSITKFLQLVPYPSTSFQIKFASYCILDALLSFLSEALCLWIFSRRNRKASEGLVKDEVVEALSDYVSNDDDILPEEYHEFGLMEMLKENMQMQKTIADKNRENTQRELRKAELTRKAAEEAMGDGKQKHKKTN
ncbi:manganese-transporting ATPase 13A1 [Histomonas meleagridis]|uniref:manganese-transporting ATPase 13A1 n=1 Tax=Histomonas meleagridis TaxID=135588 RepID=UPI00355A5BCA|nr:manganese-transporting ATPase 13A1 [Histomonas meleagridis]KAH0799069.1 manganese-transporting ATPase 13A1 [Histomonas meleagridis]